MIAHPSPLFILPAVVALAFNACAGSVGSFRQPGARSGVTLASSGRASSLPNDCFLVALEAKRRMEAVGAHARLLSSNKHVVAVIEDEGRLYAYDSRGTKRLYVNGMARNDAATVARELYGFNVRDPKWLDPQL